MQDYEIVSLYWERAENAITQTNIKYGRMLFTVSETVLNSRQDSEECVNDTYLAAWNKMPTDRPTYLGAYLTKIVRGIAIDRYRYAHSDKRGGADNVTSELDECIPSELSVESQLEAGALRDAMNSFLAGLDGEKRVMFVKRYFYMQSVAEIASCMRLGESKVKTTLHRLRLALAEKLESEGLK